MRRRRRGKEGIRPSEAEFRNDVRDIQEWEKQRLKFKLLTVIIMFVCVLLLAVSLCSHAVAQQIYDGYPTYSYPVRAFRKENTPSVKWRSYQELNGYLDSFSLETYLRIHSEP